MFGSRGLSLPLGQFLKSPSDLDLRRLFDPNVLAVLDVIFGGTIVSDVFKLDLA